MVRKEEDWQAQSCSNLLNAKMWHQVLRSFHSAVY